MAILLFFVVPLIAAIAIGYLCKSDLKMNMFLTIICSIVMFFVSFFVLAMIVPSEWTDTRTEEQKVEDQKEIRKSRALYAFEDYIKEHMNDEDSYERVSYEVYYLPKRYGYSVTIIFKGKNKFNATVKQKMTGVVLLYPDEVKILEVMELPL